MNFNFINKNNITRELSVGEIVGDKLR